MSAGAVISPIIIALQKVRPGKARNLITSATRINIGCDTPDTDIYFTIDGNKPNPYQDNWNRNTYLFTDTFTLPLGKQTVKALALKRSSKQESFVVSKNFVVEKDENVAQDTILAMDRYGFLKATSSTNLRIQSARTGTTSLSLSTKSASSHDLGGSWGKAGRNAMSASFMQKSAAGPKPPPRKASLKSITTDALKVQKKSAPVEATGGKALAPVKVNSNSDSPRCTHCKSSLALSDPLDKFCNACGAPLKSPTKTESPPEKSIEPQKTPANSTKPPILEPENDTVPYPVAVPQQSQPPPMPPHPTEGSAPFTIGFRHVCHHCGKVGEGSTPCCAWCGQLLGSRPPDLGFKDMNSLEESRPPYPSAVSAPAPAPPQPPPAAAAAAPPQSEDYTKLQLKDQTLNSTMGTTRASDGSPRATGRQHGVDRFRNPSLKPISPGNGYWRQQVDHVMGHFRSYANHNAEFQEIIGYPLIGKMVSADVSRDANYLEIKCTFRLHSDQSAAACSASSREASPQHHVTEIDQDPKQARLKEKELVNRLAVPKHTVTQGDGARGKSIKKGTPTVIPRRRPSTSGQEQPSSSAPYPPSAEPSSAPSSSSPPYPVGNSPTSAPNRMYPPSVEPSGPSSSSPPYPVEDGPKSAPNRVYPPEHHQHESQPPPAGFIPSLNGTSYPLDGVSVERQSSILLSDALLIELGPSGRGDPAEVQRLLREGANGNVTSVDGIPLLIFAVQNRHKDAIPVLLQEAGLDVNSVVNVDEMGNSALHEAVLLGESDGPAIIDILIRHGATLQKRNMLGENAYDLAQKLHFEGLAKRLAGMVPPTEVPESHVAPARVI